MAELALEGVSKTFAGSVVAVQDLELRIRDGELVVLLGPSGCGKTTTLRLVAGLDDPDSGRIRMDGQVVNRWAPRARNIAMVFQDGVLYPHLTVAGNLAASLRWRGGQGWLPGMLGGWRHAGRTARGQIVSERVQEAARILGLEHLLDRLPQQLSGGECQRVALGRALVRRPAVFLFDEPLSHLDAPWRGELRQEIKRLHQRLRATMVYVTHDQAEALALGDRIVVMRRGRMQQSGSPQEVYEQPANMFVARFLGSPGMNLIPGYRQGHVLALAGGCALPVDRLQPFHDASGGRRDGQQLTLGIRPEHLRLWPRGSAADAEERRTRSGGRTVLAGTGRVVMTQWTGPTVLATVALPGDAPEDKPAARQLTDGERRRIELAVMVPAGQAVGVGQEVAVGWDPSRLHVFDTRTGENLSAPGREMS
jgi:multiple sugar transport system ATP-binding protein